jgi:hypothetical protein
MTSPCFEIRKSNRRTNERATLRGPFGESVALRELEKLKRESPLTNAELDAGWSYELDKVDCPRTPILKTDKTRGSQGEGR